VASKDEKLYLQFAVSTLVPFWRPPKVLLPYGTLYIPPCDCWTQKSNPWVGHHFMWCAEWKVEVGTM